MAGASSDGADGAGDDAELRRATDEALLEKARRMQRALDGGIARSLPDNGAKYRRLIAAILSEIDRRSAARATDDGKQNRIVQSRCAESSVKPQAVNISDFRSSFGMDEEAGIDASHLDTSTNIGDPKTSIDNEGVSCEEEHSCKPSTSQKVSYVDSSTEMKIIDDDDDDDKDNNGYSMIHKDVHTSQKRKGEFSPAFSMRLRSRKVVEEVVLLDGDTCMSDSAEKTSSAWDAMKIRYPSWDNPNSIELSRADIKCLEPESLLSSPILNFYIMYLLGQMPSTSRHGGKYHIFNTYFFSKLEALASKVDKDAYFLNLRRWWKGVDIFQMAYIIFPVHADAHWSLVIISMPAKEDQSGPTILHLDSLKFHSSRSILSTAERFLKEEWNYLNKTGSLEDEDCHLHESVWKNLPRKIRRKAVTDENRRRVVGVIVWFSLMCG
ncbi:ubiquitin-like-specific protease 1D isoform X2 [Oryza brachyantha]|uniref:ubiquitin-like-specific protease 1D isoform X2 n=1 Tax=Oryza brachyantha TaxID=4533 RepID=UPI000776622A|nr:ubiquitin-like-specific protease 1D isoform X2 [Oryza brachyantha]